MFNIKSISKFLATALVFVLISVSVELPTFDGANDGPPTHSHAK